MKYAEQTKSVWFVKIQKATDQQYTLPSVKSPPYKSQLLSANEAPHLNALFSHANEPPTWHIKGTREVWVNGIILNLKYTTPMSSRFCLKSISKPSVLKKLLYLKT